MVAKKVATKRVTAKKTTAKKTTAPKKQAAAKPASKKKSVAKTAAPKKKAAAKTAAPKKKTAAKTAAPKKKTAAKTAAPKKKTAAKTAAPKKKAAPKKPAPTSEIAAVRAPQRTEQEVAAFERDAQRAVSKKRRAAKKAATLNDPLSPRPKRRSPQKLKVIRPGRKKMQKAIAKTKPYRALTNKQKDLYRDQLFEMRDRVSVQISSLKKDSLTRADEVNVEEDGTDAFDRQFALTLASSEHEALIKIDEALELLQHGAFGKCHVCGGAIEPARLKALPFAGNCITCESELEKQRPGYRPVMQRD